MTNFRETNKKRIEIVMRLRVDIVAEKTSYTVEFWKKKILIINFVQICIEFIQCNSGAPNMAVGHISGVAGVKLD